MGNTILNMLYNAGAFLNSIWTFLSTVFVKTVPFTDYTLWNIFEMAVPSTFLLGFLGKIIKIKWNVI